MFDGDGERAPDQNPSLPAAAGGGAGQLGGYRPLGGADCAAGGLAGTSPNGGGAWGDARPDRVD